MGESEILSRFLNPVVLNLQKMELELKCPSCLMLLDQPVLLPCDHMFCSRCISSSTSQESDCPSCKSSFVQQGLRPAVHIEVLLNIFKNMESAICANFQKQKTRADITEEKVPSRGGPVSGNNSVEATSKKDLIQTTGNESSSILQLYTSSFGNMKDRQLRSGENGIQATKRSGGCTAHQAEQHSPPSFGNIKDSDYDSSYQGIGHGRKRSPISDSCKRDLKDGNKLMKELDSGEPKRRKLNDDFDVDGKSGTNTSQNYVAEHNNINFPEIHPSNNSSYPSSKVIMKCVFCHSFRTSEATGEMLHYLNGKQMEVAEATQTNVLHVHKKCIEWAPQIYFSGESVMNLESEIARASKIKCSSCGLKGAALGCYAKSCRRSFHVPCAYEILDCRWDCENFVVLCPVHSSHKLPCDRSRTKSKNKANDSSLESPCSSEAAHSSHKLPCDRSRTKSKNKPNHSLLDQESPCSSAFLTSSSGEKCGLWSASPSLSKSWVLCGSALSREEKELLYKFAKLSGAVATDTWKPDVTHVIASTDEHGACSRTLKYLMAILGGKWVLKMKWVKDCIKAGDALAEESYEITHDVHGSSGGPKSGRLRNMEKAPKLFAGLGFYFSGHFVPSYKAYLVALVLAAGGTLLAKNDLMHNRVASIKGISLNAHVVYNAEPLQEDLDGCLKKQYEEAEAFAIDFGARVIRHTWLLDAISACNLDLAQ